MLRILKKASALMLSCVFFFSAAGGGAVFADGAAAVETGSAASCLLIEAGAGAVIYEKDADEKLPAAGLSRLPALAVICEAFDKGEIGRDAAVTVSGEAAKIGGTTAFLREGEQIDAGSLLLAAAMINAGDATHALACAVCGSEAAAAGRINSLMAEIGVSADYSDICGKDLRFSAKELAAIGALLIKSDTYSEFGAKYYETIHHSGAGDTEIVNPNKLVKQYPGCIGVATGSSKEAGYCGVFAAKRGETTMLAVILGARNSSERFAAAIALLDFGFSSSRSIKICDEGEAFGTVPVKGSLTAEVRAEAESALSMLIGGGAGNCRKEAELPEYAEAPLLKGDVIGKLKVFSAEGELIAEAPLVASCDAPALTFGDCFRFVLGLFLRR